MFRLEGCLGLKVPNMILQSWKPKYRVQDLYPGYNGGAEDGCKDISRTAPSMLNIVFWGISGSMPG